MSFACCAPSSPEAWGLTAAFSRVPAASHCLLNSELIVFVFCLEFCCAGLVPLLVAKWVSVCHRMSWSHVCPSRRYEWAVLCVFSHANVIVVKCTGLGWGPWLAPVCQTFPSVPLRFFLCRFLCVIRLCALGKGCICQSSCVASRWPHVHVMPSLRLSGFIRWFLWLHCWPCWNAEASWGFVLP